MKNGDELILLFLRVSWRTPTAGAIITVLVDLVNHAQAKNLELAKFSSSYLLYGENYKK